MVVNSKIVPEEDTSEFCRRGAFRGFCHRHGHRLKRGGIIMKTRRPRASSARSSQPAARMSGEANPAIPARIEGLLPLVKAFFAQWLATKRALARCRASPRAIEPSDGDHHARR